MLTGLLNWFSTWQAQVRFRMESVNPTWEGSSNLHRFFYSVCFFFVNIFRKIYFFHNWLVTLSFCCHIYSEFSFPRLCHLAWSGCSIDFTSASLCLIVYVCKRERERESDRVCVREKECVGAFKIAWLFICVYECESMCERERERKW